MRISDWSSDVCSSDLPGDKAYADKLARFVAASNKGWDWAVKNSDAAAMVVLDNDSTGAQTEKHQKRMMGEIAKLVEGSKMGTGYLDPADYDRTVSILLSAKSDPVITKKRSEEHTSELQSLMRISYAVFCL